LKIGVKRIPQKGVIFIPEGIFKWEEVCDEKKK
jgi:hypothetical protein